MNGKKKNVPQNDNLKSAPRRGRRIGGDDARTHEWADGEPLVGELMSVVAATTKYGDRARLTILRDDGEIVGLWMPARWLAALSPEVRRTVDIVREVHGLNQIRYDVRVLDGPDTE
jgi:hypothetical protein